MTRCLVKRVSPENRFSNSYSPSNNPLIPKRTLKSKTWTFYLFVTPTVENNILEMTNREGRRKYGNGWKGMDEADLRTNVLLLILTVPTSLCRVARLKRGTEHLQSGLRGANNLP
ncbi:unnamed protein product [Pleuronectes platessa]|uniref:Uncharacterized protein n=1 Tax=Pleuronectes platessa TaxID=8262 RepID=A0A9N7Z2Y0_PLEPL|nr:unnamed protein product [Pleuronectes platessa]